MLGHHWHGSETLYKWADDDPLKVVVCGSSHQLKMSKLDPSGSAQVQSVYAFIYVHVKYN